MDFLLRGARLLRVARLGRRAPDLDLHDVCRTPMRVWLSDLDELRHVNNGVYLSMMDVPRFELMVRSGTWAKLRAAGLYPVVVNQTISYRKSLELGQRFEIESRIVGYDDRAVFCAQRFVVDGEVYAEGWVRARFLRRSGGVVLTEELGEIVGMDPAEHPVPEWLADWAARVALPSTREPAPSDW